jgi:hypothetical protein
MMPEPFLSRRLFLLFSGGVAAGSAVVGCASPDPNFVYELLPAQSPPVKMQRLLLWLPHSDEWLDGTNLAASFVSALTPYGVVVESGRSAKLEVDRSAEQKQIVDTFKPTYRLEVDISDARTSAQGSMSVTSFLVRAVLYRGAGRTPLARFHYHARSKQIPRFVGQVVEKLKAGGYL